MELYTADLVLRTVTERDLPEVMRMWDFENGAISAEEAQKAIVYMQSNHKRNKAGCIYHLCFAVLKKDSDTIIGWCGLDGRDGKKLHIFYLMEPGQRKKGYAVQSAERLLSYAFDEMKVPFINGGCAKENIASYKVMQKIGMQPDGCEENGDPLFFLDADTYRQIHK